MTKRRFLPLALLTHLIPWTILILLGRVDRIGCSHSPSHDIDLSSDLCSTCRGTNSSCRLVAGIFTRPQLNVGYNVIALLPRGACDLNISEIRLSPNHLALRRPDGSYIFNGDWRLSPSGSYEASPGGRPWLSYKRQDLGSLESIISHGGQLPEPLELVVLYQQPNPGIRYEYVIPSNAHNQRATQSRTLAATSRTASYITPEKVRSSSSSLQQLPEPILKLYNSVASFPARTTLLEAQNPPNNEIDPARPHHIRNHHHHRHQPRQRYHGGAHNDNDNDKPPLPEKKFHWTITGYTNCSEPCGGGMQRSIIRCVRVTSGSPVPDRRCSSSSTQENKPPAQMIRCNLKPCPAEWVTGDWSGCVGECDLGQRSRTVHCQQRVSPSLTMRVAEGACLQQRPEAENPCKLDKACSRWNTSEWSECSTRCGNGIRMRSVACVGTAEIMVEEGSGCEPKDKPGEITPCNMGPCEGVSWFVSDWGAECSQTCGSGIQTRNVVCSGLDQNNSVKKSKVQYYSYEHTGKNESGIRIASSDSELETNLIEEGRMDKTDLLDEARDNEDNGHEYSCDAADKPSEQRECFSDRGCADPVWFTGDWGECSSSCGSGARTRQVLCVIFSRGRYKILSQSKDDRRYCPIERKPLDREACHSDKEPSCSHPRWFTTEWGECSVLCGGGIQKRSVTCRAENWEAGSSSLCKDEDRPIEKKSCNEFKCNTSSATPTTTSAPFTASAENNEIQVKDEPEESPVISTLKSTSSSDNASSVHNHEIPPVIDTEADAEIDDCTDEYRNCALVVQARLCRYKYYRSVCCTSCTNYI